jgi:predicted outer membrane repeat protein
MEIGSVNFSGEEVTNNALGSAIYTRGNLDLVNCRFTGFVTSGLFGGAINTGGLLRMVRCDFVGNQGGNGGGIYTIGGTTEIHTRNFIGNIATTSGGAIHANGTATVNVLHSTFSGNEARALTPGQGGGAIYANLGTFAFGQCTFYHDMAYSRGGAIFTNFSATLSQCTVTENNAGYGGAAGL